MRPIRVLVADDHTLVRAGLRALVGAMPDIEVVGEAADGSEVQALAAALNPNVVLMDIAMPGLNGLDAAARLARDLPRTRTIILSMHVSDEYVRQALQAGAAGYLLKGAAPAELEAAIRTVARGGTYLSPAMSHIVVEGYVRGGGGGPATPLTPRQREVLQLIAEGQTTKQIAARLGLSVKTVETHRTQLMERLDIHDVAGLVRYAIRIGLVNPAD